MFAGAEAVLPLPVALEELLLLVRGLAVALPPAESLEFPGPAESFDSDLLLVGPSSGRSSITIAPGDPGESGVVPP